LGLAEPAKPGIYFLSLDVDAVQLSPPPAAHIGFPHFHSRISAGSAGQGFHFDSTRTSSDGPAAYFVGAKPLTELATTRSARSDQRQP
jgi:uncharacterized protein YqjF (DUF2071 family)